MSRVEYQGVGMRFGDVVALERLDMVVKDGDFLVLLGPSGCGKTTALRILAGLENPVAGRVLIADEDVTRRQPRDRDVAMVFQNYALYPQMSVAENIAYPLRTRKVDRSDRRREVERVAELLDVAHLLERTPRQLSGGQRQRVALGRAIIRDPACFLMDEPLSNLDAQLRTVTRGEIKRLQKELATTTLYVTHDQAEAMTMADRVAVMREGRLEQLASPEEVYERPANRFIAQFIGNPPMNVIAGELSYDRRAFVFPGGEVTLSEQRFSTCAEEGAVEIGFRPEDLEIVEPGQPASVRGEVYVVEPMGNETIVEVLLVDETRVRVRTERHFRAEIRSRVGVAARPEAACIFGPDGRTVVHREGAVSREKAGAL